MDLLPERHRLVIVGYFLEGRTSQDLAQLPRRDRVPDLASCAPRRSQMLQEGIEAQYAGSDGPSDAARAGRVARRKAGYAAAIADASEWKDRVPGSTGPPSPRSTRGRAPATRRPSDSVACRNGKSCNCVIVTNGEARGRSPRSAPGSPGACPTPGSPRPPEVTADREEILVVGDARRARARAPTPTSTPARWRRRARIEGFREDTRAPAHARRRRGRGPVGAQGLLGGRVRRRPRRLFTTQSVPVMTRLRMTERAVLDTLIDAGVARSRSEALAWCVRLVGQHQSDWIAQLRDAVAHVERVRAERSRTATRLPRRGARAASEP